MHMMAQISFFFLLQTVEDGDNEETPVQEPQPEDWQRKENVCYLTKDSDSQRPSGEEQSSVSAPRLNWLSVFALWSTTSFYFVPQDKTKKVKVKNETANSAAIYKFEARRKRWETFPELLHRQSLWHRGHAHHRDISLFFSLFCTYLSKTPSLFSINIRIQVCKKHEVFQANRQNALKIWLHIWIRPESVSVPAADCISTLCQ